MKRFIKITCTCLALSMLLTLVLGNKQVGEVTYDFWGCSKKKLYEYGDFIITEDNELYDISDSGLQKEYIIFPNLTIKEVVDGLGGIWRPILFTYSDKIKKIYNVDRKSAESLRSYYIMNKDNTLIKTVKCKVFGVEVVGGYCTEIYVNELSLRNVKSMVGGVDIPKMLDDFDGYIWNLFLIANIEFMYNYENAPNYGCYWIDDLETGEILSYIPPNPTRDGYTFDGWYADSECTIEYDFTTPYIKKEFVEMETEDAYYLVYPKDYVTHIYAKWIKN